MSSMADMSLTPLDLGCLCEKMLLLDGRCSGPNLLHLGIKGLGNSWINEKQATHPGSLLLLVKPLFCCFYTPKSVAIFGSIGPP